MNQLEILPQHRKHSVFQMMKNEFKTTKKALILDGKKKNLRTIKIQNHLNVRFLFLFRSEGTLMFVFSGAFRKTQTEMRSPATAMPFIASVSNSILCLCEITNYMCSWGSVHRPYRRLIQKHTHTHYLLYGVPLFLPHIDEHRALKPQYTYRCNHMGINQHYDA